jgi:hypothetical protein
MGTAAMCARQLNFKREVKYDPVITDLTFIRVICHPGSPTFPLRSHLTLVKMKCDVTTHKVIINRQKC